VCVCVGGGDLRCEWANGGDMSLTWLCASLHTLPCIPLSYGSDTLNVYQSLLLARDFAVRIGIFGAEALFLVDNRYRFGVTAFGRQQDIIAARAMCVVVICFGGVFMWGVGGGGWGVEGGGASRVCLPAVAFPAPAQPSLRLSGVCVHPPALPHPPSPTPSQQQPLRLRNSFTAGGSKKVDVSFVVEVLQSVGDGVKSAMYASQAESDIWLALLDTVPTASNYRSDPGFVECVVVVVGGGGDFAVGEWELGLGQGSPCASQPRALRWPSLARLPGSLAAFPVNPYTCATRSPSTPRPHPPRHHRPRHHRPRHHSPRHDPPRYQPSPTSFPARRFSRPPPPPHRQPAPPAPPLHGHPLPLPSITPFPSLVPSQVEPRVNTTNEYLASAAAALAAVARLAPSVAVGDVTGPRETLSTLASAATSLASTVTAAQWLVAAPQWGGSLAGVVGAGVTGASGVVEGASATSAGMAGVSAALGAVPPVSRAHTSAIQGAVAAVAAPLFRVVDVHTPAVGAHLAAAAASGTGTLLSAADAAGLVWAGVAPDAAAAAHSIQITLVTAAAALDSSVGSLGSADPTAPAAGLLQAAAGVAAARAALDGLLGNLPTLLPQLHLEEAAALGSATTTLQGAAAGDVGGVCALGGPMTDLASDLDALLALAGPGADPPLASVATWVQDVLDMQNALGDAVDAARALLTQNVSGAVVEVGVVRGVLVCVAACVLLCVEVCVQNSHRTPNNPSTPAHPCPCPPHPSLSALPCRG
jgi:hypothetical protein